MGRLTGRVPGILENSAARSVAGDRRRNPGAARCGGRRKMGIFRVGILENSGASGGEFRGVPETLQWRVLPLNGRSPLAKKKPGVA